MWEVFAVIPLQLIIVFTQNIDVVFWPIARFMNYLYFSQNNEMFNVREIFVTDQIPL